MLQYGYMQSTPHETPEEDFKEKEPFKWGVEGCVGEELACETRAFWQRKLLGQSPVIKVGLADQDTGLQAFLAEDRGRVETGARASKYRLYFGEVYRRHWRSLAPTCCMDKRRLTTCL